jgi:hypothetical protein
MDARISESLGDLTHLKILMHSSVHRGTQENGAIEAEQSQSKQIVAESGRYPGQEVCSGGVHDDRVGPVAEIDMEFAALRCLEIPDVLRNRMTTQSVESGFPDKLFACLREDGSYFAAGLSKQSQQENRLEGTNTACDSEDHTGWPSAREVHLAGISKELDAPLAFS